MGFVANFIRVQQRKKCENRLRYDKVTESIKVGTFFETQCIGTRNCENRRQKYHENRSLQTTTIGALLQIWCAN